MGDKILNLKRKVDKIVTIVLGSISAIFVAIMISVVIVDIVGTFFKFPVTFTSELTGLMFAWTTALCAVIISIQKENITLTILLDKFPKKINFIISVFIDFLCLVFSFIMFLSSLSITKEVITQKMPLFRISKGFIYSSMIVMFLFLTISFATQMMERIILSKKNDAMKADKEIAE